MSFIWPVMLLALLAIPLGVVAYRGAERRRRQRAAAYGNLVVTATPGGRATGVRRRLPGALFLVGLTLMLIALARPQSVLGLPRLEGTVILAFDVSGSMAAIDFAPNRMEAAKTAARAFVERQPPGVVIGVVAFSDSAFATQIPTTDREAVLAAIDRLAPERGTSVGQGILRSLEAIQLYMEGPSTDYYSRPADGTTESPTRASPTAAPADIQTPATIVMLSDGENNVRPDPLEVAVLAADRGVHIHSVGIGTAAGVALEVEGFRVQTRLNEPLLRAVSEITSGTYFAAGDQTSLDQVYRDVVTRLVVREEPIEVTSLFAGGGAVVLILGALASLVWLGRLL